MTPYLSHIATRSRVALAAAIAIAPLGPLAAAEADLDAAEAIVAQYSQIPTFDPPGEAFDAASCMAGKRILSIPASSSIPFVAGIEESMISVAEEIGFEVRHWQNQDPRRRIRHRQWL